MKPLKPANWPTELDEILAFLGVPLNIHNMMAHHPELLKVWMPFRNHIVAGSSLSARHRELIILRTAHFCQAGYEWLHHVERGLAVGLTHAEIERVKQGPDAVGWRADESALLLAVDDCHRGFQISAQHLRALESHFNRQQQLDLMATVGMYLTLSLIIKTWDVPMESD